MDGDIWLKTGFPVETWTLREVAAMLKVNPESLRTKCSQNGIGVKVLKRWRFTRDHIELLMEQPCLSGREGNTITTSLSSVENDFEALLKQATG